MTVGVDCSRIELTLTLTRTPTQECLAGVGIDCSWIKRAEMLNAWIDAHSGGPGASKRSVADYTDDELRDAFEAIDVDKSGDIDLDELRTAITAIKKVRPRHEPSYESMPAIDPTMVR